MVLLLVQWLCDVIKDFPVLCSTFLSIASCLQCRCRRSRQLNIFQVYSRQNVRATYKEFLFLLSVGKIFPTSTVTEFPLCINTCPPLAASDIKEINKIFVIQSG